MLIFSSFVYLFNKFISFCKNLRKLKTIQYEILIVFVIDWWFFIDLLLSAGFKNPLWNHESLTGKMYKINNFINLNTDISYKYHKVRNIKYTNYIKEKILV